MKFPPTHQIYQQIDNHIIFYGGSEQDLWDAYLGLPTPIKINRYQHAMFGITNEDILEMLTLMYGNAVFC